MTPSATVSDGAAQFDPYLLAVRNMNDRTLRPMRINEPLGTITTWLGSGKGQVLTLNT